MQTAVAFDYSHKHTDDRKLIYDIGFHTGQDTAYYLARGFKVVAVEANPALAEEGRQRFNRAINSGRLVILNEGIAHEAGHMTFYINPDMTEFSSFDRPIAARQTKRLQEVPIKTRRLLDIVQEHGPAHYIKLDIEGFDHIAIESLTTGSDRTKPLYLSIENGQPNALKTLQSLGYQRFAWVNQARVPENSVPAQSKEGAPIVWTFPYGASGLFGSDLEWASFDEVMAASQVYWSGPHLDPVANGWFDVHAAR
jgi:FkbM family methyltransferase